MRFVSVLTLTALLCTSCSGVSLPSQSHPVCSWSVRPPARAAADCRVVLSRLQQLATAIQHRDHPAIERIAANAGVAHRIETYADSLHAIGTRGLHIVPSITVNVTVQHWIGADFSLIGRSRIDKVKSENIVYFRLHGSDARIVADEAGEDL